jgi:hypothetical protein
MASVPKILPMVPDKELDIVDTKANLLSKKVATLEHNNIANNILNMVPNIAINVLAKPRINPYIANPATNNSATRFTIALPVEVSRLNIFAPYILLFRLLRNKS